jgi:hypothetical protein
MTTGTATLRATAAGPSSAAVHTKKGDAILVAGTCKKAYLDYLGNKTQEIEEQKERRRYYHGAHWTEEQLKVLKKRKQPPITKNRIARKIDGVVG